eukprot:jgi/Tetstr1/423091/TSEL_013862.t1
MHTPSERVYAPVGLTNPGLWNPRNDKWDRYLTDETKHATRDDEYRHLLCYGVFTAAAHAALTDAMATLPAKNATARDTADANDPLDSAIRTIATGAPTMIIDLRVLNSYCVRKRLKMETLLGVRHLTGKGDYVFSVDLQDGFYALGIAETDRD